VVELVSLFIKPVDITLRIAQYRDDYTALYCVTVVIVHALLMQFLLFFRVFKSKMRIIAVF
jgi:hypothetical protein